MKGLSSKSPRKEGSWSQHVVFGSECMGPSHIPVAHSLCTWRICSGTQCPLLTPKMRALIRCRCRPWAPCPQNSKWNSCSFHCYPYPHKLRCRVQYQSHKQICSHYILSYFVKFSQDFRGHRSGLQGTGLSALLLSRPPLLLWSNVSFFPWSHA